jgi:hypothetical protein
MATETSKNSPVDAIPTAPSSGEQPQIPREVSAVERYKITPHSGTSVTTGEAYDADRAMERFRSRRREERFREQEREHSLGDNIRFVTSFLEIYKASKLSEKDGATQGFKIPVKGSAINIVSIEETATIDALKALGAVGIIPIVDEKQDAIIGFAVNETALAAIQQTIEQHKKRQQGPSMGGR